MAALVEPAIVLAMSFAWLGNLAGTVGRWLGPDKALEKQRRRDQFHPWPCQPSLVKTGFPSALFIQ